VAALIAVSTPTAATAAAAAPAVSRLTSRNALSLDFGEMTVRVT